TGPQGPPGPPGAPGGPGSPGATGQPGAPGGSAGGVTIIDFREDGGASRVVFDRGGLIVTASCTAGPAISVKATTSVDHSILHVATVSAGTPPTTTYLQKNDFLVSSQAQDLATTGHTQ